MNNDKHDYNVDETLDDIKEIVKIEKIHEEDTYFDKLADDIEIEIRDVLMDKDALTVEFNKKDMELRKKYSD